MNMILTSIKKWFLLFLLIIVFCSFFYFNLNQYLTFNTIKNYQANIQTWTELHYKSSVLFYILVFTILIACAIPCATFFTLLGGFLFGVVAVIYAMLGTTLGGVVLFLAIRWSIGERVAVKSSGWIKIMEHGFQQNAFHYLLMLRLVPIFPCWISNISAGALNVPLKTFIFATILGIFPATFIYVMVGRGLDQLFLLEQPPNLDMLLIPSIFLPLLGLAFLSLCPILYKYFKLNRKS